jgi:phosphoribosyl 1,2-cyclic phosphodiesterase
MSECIPKGTAVVLDAGSGFVPLSLDLLKEGDIREVVVLFSHWHHDHTQGLLLSPVLFMKSIDLKLVGPVQNGVDPKQMLEDMMRPPYFPVHWKRVDSHITTKGLEFPETWVGLFHPQGGIKVMRIEEYERLLKEGKFLPIGKGKYPVEECLVLTMHTSNHPEETISYRFDEKPTGKSFVFLTDHENQAALPLDLKRHLQGATLLLMDSQYRQEVYDQRTAGYGHGTPGYCVKVASQVGAKMLGLTHHDPSSTDDDIEEILREAVSQPEIDSVKVFACADYQEVEV